MNIQELSQLYAHMPQVSALAKVMGDSKSRNIFLSNNWLVPIKISNTHFFFFLTQLIPLLETQPTQKRGLLPGT